MKLKINKACDLGSISVLPPSRTGGRGGVGAAASASAAAASQPRSQTLSQQSFSHSQSQVSQTSIDENLHLPSSSGDQRFGLHDGSSKRMASLPAGSASCTREESQLQLVKVSSNPLPRWNTTPFPDNRCQVNEELERKFQHLASSVHRMGMVLDSVQNDVMQLNRAMKEALLDSGSIRQKVLLLDNSVQQILKGQDDLKERLEGRMKSNTDQLSVLNSNSSKLKEISSALSGCSEQMQVDLGKLQSNIFRILTKEMEGIIRAIRSPNVRPAAVEMPALKGQSCMTNEELLRNQMPLTKVHPAPSFCPRRAADPKPKVEEGRVNILQQKLTSSSFRPPPKQEQVATRKAQKDCILIDSDDDSRGGASCMIVKKERADIEPSWMKEAREESLHILRKARKRKRREMNSILISC